MAKSSDHSIRPQDLLHFIELRPFTRRWKELGLNDEEDLTALQVLIMTDPRRGVVVEGTHGLRKLRFVPPHWRTGKSGAVRVLYVLFERYGIVLLAVIYAKNERDNISSAVKQYLNKLIAEQESEFARRKSL